MISSHTHLNLKTFSNMPYVKPYPIHNSSQCLGNYRYDKNVWQERLNYIKSQLDIFKGNVENMEGNVAGVGVLEVLNNGQDGKQDLITDLRRMESIASTLSNNMMNIKRNLDNSFTKFSSLDESAYELWQRKQESIYENSDIHMAFFDEYRD